MDSQRYARRFPTVPLHRHDMQPGSVSTHTHSLLEAEVQLHIMLHVYCRSDNAGGRRAPQVTTLLRGDEMQNYKDPRVASQPSQQIHILPKVVQHSRCARNNAHENHKCHTESKLSAAKASVRRNRLSSLERESALSVCVCERRGCFHVLADPALFPLLSPSPNHHALGGDGSGSLV